MIEFRPNISKLSTFEKLWSHIETQILQTKMHHTKAQQIFNIQTHILCKRFSEITQQIQLKRQFSHPKVLKAGGKPSTWFPPGGLVEQRNHADKPPTPINKHADKAKEIQAKNKSREKQNTEGAREKTNHEEKAKSETKI